MKKTKKLAIVIQVIGILILAPTLILIVYSHYFNSALWESMTVIYPYVAFLGIFLILLRIVIVNWKPIRKC